MAGGGFRDTEGPFIGDRWTQPTLLVNFMTHAKFTQRILSVSSAVVNPLFSRVSKHAEEAFATPARAK